MIHADQSGGRRTKRGDLETAVYTFHRAMDNRTITLVGTVHMAEADYYRQLRDIVDELADSGAEVHYEGGRSVEDSAYQTPAEAAAVEQLGTSVDVIYQQAIEAFGLPWVFQFASALAPAPTWKNIDITDLENVRLTGPGHESQFDRTEATIRKLINIHARKADKPRVQKLMVGQFIRAYIRRQCRLVPNKVLLTIVNTVRAVARKPPTGPSRHEATTWFVFRECQAALAALDAAKDVVMVWHAYHQPGLASVLLRNDFALRTTNWLTAVRVPQRQEKQN